APWSGVVVSVVFVVLGVVAASPVFGPPLGRWRSGYTAVAAVFAVATPWMAAAVQFAGVLALLGVGFVVIGLCEHLEPSWTRWRLLIQQGECWYACTEEVRRGDSGACGPDVSGPDRRTRRFEDRRPAPCRRVARHRAGDTAELDRNRRAKGFPDRLDAGQRCRPRRGPPTAVIVDYIDAHRERFGVDPICAVLTEHGISIAPSTYYKAKSRGRVSATELADAYAANTVHAMYVANRRVYGVRKLWHAMKR